MSLVANYNSSGDSDDSSDNTSDKEEEVNNELPLPSLSKLDDAKSLEKLRERKRKEHSVYSNPYIRNEEQSLAIISKHTELTDKAEETAEDRKLKKRLKRRQTSKPCAHFAKKGTCRYGETCKFLHNVPNTSNNVEDKPSPNINNISSGLTDVSPAISQTSNVSEILKKKNKNITNVCYMDAPVDIKNEVGDTDDALWEGGKLEKKKRPGLSDDIIPSKKVYKMYRGRLAKVKIDNIK